MKKQALRKDTIREIKGSIGRFISILLIIAVGVGVFAGVKATAPSMKYSAEKYFNENHLYDFELLSTVGFSDDDVTQIKKIDEIDRVMPAYSLDVLYFQNDTEYVIKMMSLPEENEDSVNTPLVTEGRLPEKENECVLVKSDLYDQNLRLGDKFTIQEQQDAASDQSVMKIKSFEIVGFVKLPQYISDKYGSSSIGNGTVSGIVLVQKSNFSYPRYTEIFLTIKYHLQENSSFDSAYDDEVKKVSEKLSALGLEQFKAFVNGSQNSITSAEAELIQGREEAERQFAEAKNQLDNAEEEISEGQQELNQGKEQYAQQSSEAYSSLNAARAELDSAWAEYRSGEQSYQNALAEYEKDLADYEARKYRMLLVERIAIEIRLEATKIQLDSAKEELDAGLAQLNAKESEYAAALNRVEGELGKANDKLVAGENQLNSAIDEYYIGLAQYNEQVQKTKAELDKGQNQIQNAKLELADVIDGKWYCMTRKDLMSGYKDFGNDAERIDAIANVFPIFFLLVAALVCMTTMSRMIDEQRMQLGTYKALGYKQGEIISKYLVYASLAGICGCIIGPALFISILPRVIFSAYVLLYNLPSFYVVIPWTMVLIAVAVALACIIIVALIACLKELRSPASTLMRPKSPKAGKTILLERISFLWKHFSFFSKLTARNLFRYKRRLLMTIIGIMGSMALIVAGFGLDNAITPIVGLQYQELSHYDATIYLNQGTSLEKINPNLVALKNDQRVKDVTLMRDSEVKAGDIGETKILDNTYLTVVKDVAKIPDYLVLRDPDTKETLSLDDEGTIITEKMAKELKAKVGDEVMMKVGENNYKVKVSGIAECYIYNHFYMTSAYYTKITNSEADYNAIYLIESEKMDNYNEFSKEWLNKCDIFVTFTFNVDLESRVSEMITSLKMVVLVMIICAGLLAFVVLYNLTNINISERTREIATVKVLGFNPKETNSYVFRENIIMSILGILIGCIAGYFLAQYIISTIEVSMVTFYREIKFTSYIFSAILTMLFTLLVNIVMSKKIKKISMVESLKAVE